MESPEKLSTTVYENRYYTLRRHMSSEPSIQDPTPVRTGPIPVDVRAGRERVARREQPSGW